MAQKQSSSVVGAPCPDRELLAFRLGDQEFCIDIMAVREIRGWTPTTPLPHAPSYVHGVVNLRGMVLPVLDLADRLGLAATTPSPQHVIIVAEFSGQVVGLLVSAVCGILTFDETSMQPTPDVASELAKSYVRGLLTVDDRLVALLRTDQLVPAGAILGEDAPTLAAA